MYLLYNKINKIVGFINDKPFVAYDKNKYQECYVETLPNKTNAQYFAVDNVREETKVIKEAYKQEESVYNEETGLDELKVIEYPTITETYLTCDLIVNNKPQPSEEEKAKAQAKAQAKVRIAELKRLLSESDYIAIKYAEGWITVEEYAEIKAQRQSYRNEINKLETL